MFLLQTTLKHVIQRYQTLCDWTSSEQFCPGFDCHGWLREDLVRSEVQLLKWWTMPKVSSWTYQDWSIGFFIWHLMSRSDTKNMFWKSCESPSWVPKARAGFASKDVSSCQIIQLKNKKINHISYLVPPNKWETLLSRFQLAFGPWRRGGCYPVYCAGRHKTGGWRAQMSKRAAPMVNFQKGPLSFNATKP